MRVPRTLALAALLAFASWSFYLFFTPSNIITDINQYFNLNLPLALETPYAFVYAAIPAAFSIYVTYLVAHSLRRREV